MPVLTPNNKPMINLILSLTYVQDWAKLLWSFNDSTMLWSRRSISNTVKFRLYSMIELSTELHACETWKSTVQIRNSVDVFHWRCIRKILGVSWHDHMTNKELMERSGMQSLIEMAKTQRPRLAGHVLRQPEDRPINVAT